MANPYHVALRPIGRHPLPPLLTELGAFVGTKQHGSLGWFDALATEEIPRTWDEANAERLVRAGFVFLALPEGSLHDEDGAVRERKVRAKKAKKPFDVQAWLDGDAAAVAALVARIRSRAAPGTELVRDGLPRGCGTRT